ncbi:cysteine hydrolase family protein [Actinacidiphila acidipaludis]|uniref:Cysteine hydrolase n=1 Tax=Actinacidiphila acidipaludis TaxID=2873382 RepID=A0ABS7QGF0_9ACTN|nr:isochorismatase family cysteine hydrolase [Streptomyces acidipaludis]MBY8882247.1 cysteine hydrolase [Streptomyces acidipaludis]
MTGERRTMVVVIDMINTYDHEDASLLVRSVREVLPAVRSVVERARRAGVGVVYVNDSFGRWRSNHDELVDAALAGPHADLVEPILPDKESLFVVKARHSIFYETPLEYLLRQEGVEHVVLCGQVTEQCVLYSALDAHIRHFEVTVVRDAVAHIHADLADAALRMMERNMGAELTNAAALSF